MQKSEQNTSCNDPEFIRLQSENDVPNCLIKVENNKYRLSTPYDYEIQFDDNGQIEYFKPKGGPMLKVGEKIEGLGKTVKHIDRRTGVIEIV